MNVIKQIIMFYVISNFIIFSLKSTCCVDINGANHIKYDMIVHLG
jgi:hypothetical protein